ncbi:MAG: HAD family hydrolase [Nanoarchaeota archaeon]|nr:HAD family hydrolase [Acidobacteriota bacterium]MBU4352961.1 HAD family hydrolase [Nanoarchaeota archaeon]
MKKAIFLDRDGTLIEDSDYAYRIEDLKIYPGVVEGLKLLQNDYLFFIITNQSGIGKGFYTTKDFHRFNNSLLEQLKNQNIIIERTYFCPHIGNCECKKPSTKYIEEIVSEFGINLAESWVVGDHPSDIIMGKNVGCKTAYLLAGHGTKHFQELELKRINPTIIAEDFLYVAKQINYRT